MTTTILLEKQCLRIAIMPIDELKPHEKGSPLYLEMLRQELLKDETLKYPIIAEEKTRVILDGMHRWLALKSLGYTRIPTILVDTYQDPNIRVGTKRTHRYVDDPTSQIAKDKIISAGLTGHLMKPRSTRHFFPFSKFQRIDYPLELLGRRAPQDVSRYVAKMSRRKGCLVIREWVKEISEELDFLRNRREEIEEEMNDLLARIKNANLLVF